jgi:hypothetical protein
LSCLPGGVSNSIRSLTDNIPKTVCGLSNSLSCTVNGIVYSAADRSQETALALLFLAARERVVEGVCEVS